ncbi:MAG: HAMP domain-containing histidine kinase [Lachnospiraceae bacterium]|nr:HAMP domain-containing histidine kinase [Lachnospiraceae bacterium]
MKKYDRIMAATLLLWLIIAVGVFYFTTGENQKEDMNYKVEINQIMTNLVNQTASAAAVQSWEDGAAQVDLSGLQYVKSVSFLPAEMISEQYTGTSAAKTDGFQQAGTDSEQPVRLHDFFRNHNGVHSVIYPIISGENVTGYVRFDYVTDTGSRRMLWVATGGMLAVGLVTLTVLWYVRMKVIKPFHVISSMPYELAKGNLAVEPQESKSRFFGKFVWGLGMLRDALYDSRNKALELEKEKKLMILSVSHDIKIPLSAIKLYARALREGLCESEAQRDDMAAQIEKHAGEIDEFVKEIVSTASEEIIEIEVADTEFYLRDYVNKIKEYYEPRCRLMMTRFHIGAYENKLLQGDMDRAFEVAENLMENAFKYGDGRLISLSFREEDYCQIVEVFSTGTPVPAKELPHLFDSFYRGSNAKDRSGNGLGLYIGRQIMLKMKGDIFAQRTQDGMKFCLVFRT